jgi:hypothetical protein
MAEYRWPVIITTALLALGLFFGFSYYRQRFLMMEPFIGALRRMESVEDAVLIRENGSPILVIETSARYTGSLQEVVEEIWELAKEHKQKPFLIQVTDERNGRLDSFARAVSPDLYEAAKLGNYRSVGETIHLTAAAYGLAEVQFSVDYHYLYLQARDGSAYLYQLIPLNRPDGEGA